MIKYLEFVESVLLNQRSLVLQNLHCVTGYISLDVLIFKYNIEPVINFHVPRHLRKHIVLHHTGQNFRSNPNISVALQERDFLWQPAIENYAWHSCGIYILVKNSFLFTENEYFGALHAEFNHIYFKCLHPYSTLSRQQGSCIPVQSKRKNVLCRKTVFHFLRSNMHSLQNDNVEVHLTRL